MDADTLVSGFIGSFLGVTVGILVAVAAVYLYRRHTRQRHVLALMREILSNNVRIRLVLKEGRMERPLDNRAWQELRVPLAGELSSELYGRVASRYDGFAQAREAYEELSGEHVDEDIAEFLQGWADGMMEENELLWAQIDDREAVKRLLDSWRGQGRRREAGGPERRGLVQILVPFMLPYWPAIFLAFLLVVAGTAAGLARPWPLKFLFDNVLTAESLAGGDLGSVQWTLVAIVGAIAGIAIVNSILGYFRQYILRAAGQKVAFRLRVALFGKMQRLPLTYHDRQRTGDLITRVTKDVDKVQDLITNNIVEASSNGLTLVGMLAIMFWLDWQLSLAMLGLGPILIFATSRYRRLVKNAEGDVRRKEGDIASHVQETISSIRLVKAFGREEFESDRFETHSGEALDANLRVSRTEAAFSSLINVLTALALAGLVWLGAQRVVSGNLSIGELIVFIQYLRDFYGPIRTLSKLSGQVSRTSVRAEKIAEVLREEPTVRDLPDAQPAPAFQGHIQFEDVSFGYIPGHPVIFGMSFEVQPGQVVALVGPTGAGKSTMAALLPRLYDPSEGRVLIDGQDIRKYKLSTLQPQVSLVLQNSVLFHATIRENIAYGRPEATFDDIVGAANVANAHEFITALPDGYDTVIGERGETLSGGQRQRIAIARAVVRDAPILILDEPTTGLDAKSEQLVLDALDHLMEGRTTVIIAHKLSTIRRADLILVIDGGHIVERGSHQELLALGASYAELHGLQTASPRAPASVNLPQKSGAEYRRGRRV